MAAPAKDHQNGTPEGPQITEYEPVGRLGDPIRGESCVVMQGKKCVVLVGSHDTGLVEMAFSRAKTLALLRAITLPC